MIKTQLTLYLKNRPGELARATNAITAADVNIEGLSIAATADVGLVQIIASNTARVRKALNSARIPFTEQKVAVLRLKDRPGELGKLAKRLARKMVNINCVYATAPPPGARGECSVVINADDLQQVEALQKK
jgi:hypothetical protein